MYCCVTLAICSGLCLVAASGTIGLEYREGMCRLEFCVCVVMRGGEELMWQ